jgi:hypothetical protein
LFCLLLPLILILKYFGVSFLVLHILSKKKQNGCNRFQ